VTCRGKWWAAAAAVHVRGVVATLLRWNDQTGYTVPCRGCDSPWPHDAHLARGALTYLKGRR
jgi:hypothetical protein